MLISAVALFHAAIHTTPKLAALNVCAFSAPDFNERGNQFRFPLLPQRLADGIKIQTKLYLRQQVKLYLLLY
ncbi:hypothetical protein [Pantoea brenneri]|uniref:hypothetical protein n=1 Tax=Pantoea brenneri TaxID=472694 RepID=UPI0028A2B3E9|nr:hypothetical protein [Pantoea brenneri]